MKMPALKEKSRGWVDGDGCIVYQRCRACDNVWYFRRDFCPRCGSHDLQVNNASGFGHVCALTLVHRAPSEELGKQVPYLVILVDADEGFRLMAHGNRSLAIGDRVQATYIDFAGRLIPFFEKA